MQVLGFAFDAFTDSLSYLSGIAGEFKFVSATYRLFKVPKGNTKPCKAIYNGNITGAEDTFKFDCHYTFKVCGHSRFDILWLLQNIPDYYYFFVFHRKMKLLQLMERLPQFWLSPDLKRASLASHQEAPAGPVALIPRSVGAFLYINRSFLIYTFFFSAAQLWRIFQNL